MSDIDPLMHPGVIEAALRNKKLNRGLTVTSEPLSFDADGDRSMPYHYLNCDGTVNLRRVGLWREGEVTLYSKNFVYPDGGTQPPRGAPRILHIALLLEDESDNDTRENAIRAALTECCDGDNSPLLRTQDVNLIVGR